MRAPVPVTPPANTAVKVLIGCLIVFVLLALIGGGLLWWFVIRPVSGAVRGLADLGQLEVLDRQIRNSAPYGGAADQAVQQDQLSRFLEVQRAIKAQVGGQFSQLESKYQALEQNPGANFGQALEGLGDFFKVVVSAKEAQVAALNAQNFSRDEYSWVRDRVYQAAFSRAGTPFTGFPSLQGEAAQPSPAPSSEALAQTLERIQTVQDELIGNAPLHFFGL